MRVIAGKFKGRRLKPPAWDGLRPTSDKLRETLFNILAPRIEGARLLDGFAGTGAVGIEALSRGAAHVTFIEQDRRAVALIEANLAVCGVAAGYTIEHRDLIAGLRHAAGAAFDVVWLDPPYDSADIGDALAAAAGSWLRAAWSCSNARPAVSPTCRRRSRGCATSSQGTAR